MISAVGSLSEAYLRLADQRQATRFQGPYEIVSLTGTLGGDTLHMHLAISDGFGVTVGGHLQSGCIVHTTCELVLIESVDLVYRREPDTKTGYNELVISSR